jgi:hypothetical protein
MYRNLLGYLVVCVVSYTPFWLARASNKDIVGIVTTIMDGYLHYLENVRSTHPLSLPFLTRLKSSPESAHLPRPSPPPPPGLSSPPSPDLDPISPTAISTSAARRVVLSDACRPASPSPDGVLVPEAIHSHPFPWPLARHNELSPCSSRYLRPYSRCCLCHRVVVRLLLAQPEPVSSASSGPCLWSWVTARLLLARPEPISSSSPGRGPAPASPPRPRLRAALDLGSGTTTPPASSTTSPRASSTTSPLASLTASSPALGMVSSMHLLRGAMGGS